MYESYWNLTQRPFEDTPDPRFYYPGESHQSALLKLRYAVENRRGGALLAGPSGSGKSLLLGMLREGLGEEFAPFVHVVFPRMTPGELLTYLASGFTGQESTNGDPTGVAANVRRIERFLADNVKAGRHAVLAVDEAHLVDDAESLEALRLLLNFTAAGEQGMTLLLVGQTGLLPMLDRMPQLEERLAVKSLLRPFSEDETAAYVAHRLKVAGAAETIFEPEATPTLWALSRGVARRINRLGDLALLIGYAEERRTLSAEHIEAVSEELVAVVPE
jgi:type II secretory pathway predicted ATPase ExeA